MLEAQSPLNVLQMLLVASTSSVSFPTAALCMALSRNLMEGWMKGRAKDSGHHLDV